MAVTQYHVLSRVVDVLVLDLKMPLINGIGVTTRSKAGTRRANDNHYWQRLGIVRNLRCLTMLS
jgi:CheY-like chemotaxis protein